MEMELESAPLSIGAGQPMRGNGGRRTCPLCAPARPNPPAPPEGAEGAQILEMDEAMLRFFGIGGEWLGWPICGVHLGEYRGTQAHRGAQADKGKEKPAAEEGGGEGGAQQQLGHKRRRGAEEGQQRAGKEEEEEPEDQQQQDEHKRAGKKQQREKKQRSMAPAAAVAPALDPVPLRPIGLFESCFLERHGTPRQGLLVPSSRGKLTLRRSEVLTNPKDALIGLEGHSHVWIVFLFHNNVGNPKNRIQPPRLGGRKLGMLATRTPHRPCPIGLSVARVESIAGETLHLSGVDLVNNTPVLDIKPYIPRYDAITDAITADWLVELDGKQANDEAEEGKEDEQEAGSGRLKVVMSDEAIASLQRHAKALRFFKNDWERARRCIEEVLALDIRTLHMKRKHKEGIYDVRIDLMNITFVVNTDTGVCTVQKIELWPESYDYDDFNEVKKKRLAPAAERPDTTGTAASTPDSSHQAD